MTQKTPPLPQFPFIAELSDEAHTQLRGATQYVSLPPRTQVLKQGDAVSGVYLVESGSLRIYYVNSEGREGTLYWVDAGQSCILALNCLFSELAYPAWVETDDTATRVAIITGSTYRSLYLSEPALQTFTFETLSTRLFDLMSLLQETASFGLEQRVASFLLRRSTPDGTLDVTHERIAKHLGTSREVASRVLRNLARRGAIQLAHRSIVLTNPASLGQFIET